jgi:hypothetical protein
VLFAMARSLTRFMIAATAVFGVLTFGNAMKLSTLGAPVMPDDFAAARNMFLLLDGWSLVAGVLLVAVPSLLLVWSIDWKRRWTWANLALIGAWPSDWWSSVPSDLVRLMDQRFGHSVWNQPANYQSRGLPIHLLQETTRALAQRVPPPTAPEVDQALQLVAGEPDGRVHQGHAEHHRRQPRPPQAQSAHDRPGVLLGSDGADRFPALGRSARPRVPPALGTVRTLAPARAGLRWLYGPTRSSKSSVASQ